MESWTWTVSLLLDRYLSDCELRGCRAMKHRSRQARTVSHFLGEERVEDLHPLQVYELQQRVRMAGYSGSTVNGIVGTLRAAFRFGARAGIVRTRIEFPRELPARNPRRGFLDAEDYRAIRRELPDWARDIFTFLFHSGWRRSEVISLRWDEVDLLARVVRLDPARSKTREPRTIPFLGEIGEVIDRRSSERVAWLDLVFHRAGRRFHPSTFNRVFREAAIRAGRPKALIHDCRRSTYRGLLSAGVRDRVAREMMGWRGPRMPEWYGIVSERDLLEAAMLYDEHQLGGRKNKGLTSRPISVYGPQRDGS